MNILLITSIFSFMVVVLSFWFMPYVTPKSIRFGVRIPREYENDPAITDVGRTFHRMIITAAVPLFILLILLPSLFGLVDVTLFSMPAVIVFTYLPYYRSFRKLHSIKVERGWYRNRVEATSAFYSTDSVLKKSLPGFLFIIPAIIVVLFTIYIGITVYPTLPSMIPTHFGGNGIPDQYSAKSIGSVFTGTFVQIGLTAGMFLLGIVITKTGQVGP